MFDHMWGDAEKIYKPSIRFDHLWGDAEKIDEPPIMFDHLWGDAEKIDKPPIMFYHLWGDAEKIPITLTYDKNQGVQLALSAKQVYIDGGEANLSPLYIHSDQGRNFEIDLFGSVCELLDIVKTRTTQTHPASNGQVERYNTILLALILCHIDGASDKWDEAVPLLAGAIRSRQNRHTGMTANMLMLGREVRRPIWYGMVMFYLT